VDVGIKLTIVARYILEEIGSAQVFTEVFRIFLLGLQSLRFQFSETSHASDVDRLLAVALTLVGSFAHAVQPATIRLDYTHIGNAQLRDRARPDRAAAVAGRSETAVRQHQPRQKPRRSGRRQDRRPALLARFLHRVRRRKTTEEANKISRGFHESVQL